MTRFVGIDPGAKGSFCFLDSKTKEIEFWPNPIMGIYSAVIYDLIMDRNKEQPIHMIGIEEVHSIFGTSAKSNFSFGFNVGIVHTIADLTSIGVDLVQPKEWQKACGIRFKTGMKPAEKKQVTVGRALQLYPAAPLHGPKGGIMDGRADALMIAHYLSLKYGGKLT